MGRINVGSASGEIMLCFVQGITGNRPVRCNSYEEPPTSVATTTKRKYVLLKSR